MPKYLGSTKIEKERKMINFKNIIANAISKVVNINETEIEMSIEKPKGSENGDYAFPCFRLAKELHKAPQMIANDIKENIKVDENQITKIEVVGGYLNFFIHNGQGWQEIQCDPFTGKMNEWHHIAAVYSVENGGTISLYANGKMLVTKTNVGEVNTPSYDLMIGNCPQTNRYGKSDISSLRIYSEALSEAQLNLSYNAKLAKKSVELWYDFGSPEGVADYVSEIGDTNGDGAVTPEV